MSKKILTIDNDASSTRLIEYIMKQQGYHVITAENGLDGLQRAREEDPDLIILDLVLPGIDGFEVCSRLRAEETTAQLPILILSGKAQEKDKATALKLGVNDFIAKPAKPSEILNAAQSLLANGTNTHSKTIAFIRFSNEPVIPSSLVNIASSLSQSGKNVILLDFCTYDGSTSQFLGIQSRNTVDISGRVASDHNRDKIQYKPYVHETGIHVLRVDEHTGATSDILNANITFLFDDLAAHFDYLLVDLPFEPTAVVQSALAHFETVVLLSDCTVEALTEVKATIKVLNFLGISSENINLVMTDPKGSFPVPVIDTIAFESYIMANMGIVLLGIVPFDIKYHSLVSSEDVPVISSYDQSLVAEVITGIARKLTPLWTKTS